MGRKSFRRIRCGTYNKCTLCDYEVRNNNVGMRLHLKYSHPQELQIAGAETKINNRLLCAVCKKPECREH